MALRLLPIRIQTRGGSRCAMTKKMPSQLFRRIANGFFPIFWELAGVCLIAGCNYARNKTSMLNATDASFESVQKYILAPSCVGCHSGPGSPMGVDLVSRQSILDLHLVLPGKPESSPLYDSVSKGRMPKGRTPLSPAEMRMLHDWIMKEGESVIEKPPSPPPAPTYIWISEYVFRPACLKCHDGTNSKTKLDLRTYEDLMNYQGELLNGVEPGVARVQSPLSGREHGNDATAGSGRAEAY